MTIHDSDGISEEVERQLQLAISAAALGARKVFASRHAALAAAYAHSNAHADQLCAQLDRDRVLASARLQPVFDRAWWQHATPAEVGEMWQETQQWRDFGDPATPAVFAHAADRIQQETRERWQLDIRDVTALAYADNVTEHDQLTPSPAASADQQLTAEPAPISVNDSEPIAVPPDPALDERYDTAERRERLRARMEAANVPDDAIQARLLADIAQGRPVADAVQQPPDLGHDQTRPRSRTRAPRQQRTR